MLSARARARGSTGPGGTVTLFTAWGFLAGQAPPGTSSLAVAASGFSMIRGNCWTPGGGYARAYGDIFVVVEEFEPVGAAPAHAGSSLIDLPDTGTERLAPDPAAVLLATSLFKRRVHSASTILINQETIVLGYQIVALDNHEDATVLVMPITPGNVYRWWIASYQYCQVGGPGWAGSKIAFDFEPVFFAFT